MAALSRAQHSQGEPRQLTEKLNGDDVDDTPFDHAVDRESPSWRQKRCPHPLQSDEAHALRPLEDAYVT